MHEGRWDARHFASDWSVAPAEILATVADLRIVRWDGIFDGPQSFPCQTSPYSVVAVHENLIEGHTLWIDGREVRTGPIRPGAIQIVPEGSEAGGRCGAGAYHFTHIQVPRVALVDAALDLELARFELVDPRYEMLDVDMVAIARRLARALASPEPADRLVAEELSQATLTHLLRAYGGGEDRRPALGSLVAWRLRRVVALVEDSLPSPVPLTAMAAAAELSTSRFREAFTRAVGVAPSVYVMQRRIALARRLLAKTDRPVGAIAVACGFADGQHFAHRFRAVVGASPSAYRADRR